MAKCPKCASKDWYPLAGGAAQAELGVCAGCRALLRNTPFGVDFVADDAAERFPEIIEWWGKKGD